MKSKIIFLAILFWLGYSFLIFRLYDLQVGKTNLVKAEHNFDLQIKNSRGIFFFTDRHNNSFPVALNRTGDFRNPRYCPLKNLASQLIGYVGYTKENKFPTGLYGLERYYNQQLEQGEDQYLTIDINIQNQAESILEQLIKRTNAQAGTIIVQNPNSGEILALASKPDFNPNQYNKANPSLFVNQAICKRYEPGSVIKPFTIAAGLDSGSFTPDYTLFDPGKITIGPKTITNWDNKSYGEITIKDVLEHSINTGAVLLEKKIGHQTFCNYLKKFGFDQPTGIDFPFEQHGDLSNLKDNQPLNFACASFGQGISVTPIELINAFSSLINGGKLMRPYLNKKLGKKIIGNTISPEVSKQIKSMLISTVEKAGVAVIDGYKIGGKTGTAQVPDLENGGYSSEAIPELERDSTNFAFSLATSSGPE